MAKLYVITGVMASGKSTVAEALAKQLPRAIHLRGDVFRKMIVSGREEMSENPSDEAMRQLLLRYRLTAEAARGYLDADFDVVVQDNYLGRMLSDFMSELHGLDPHVVVICPRTDVVASREAARSKVGYRGFSVEGLHTMFMEETPRVGIWLDTSDMSVEETVEAILKDVT